MGLYRMTGTFEMEDLYHG